MVDLENADFSQRYIYLSNRAHKGVLTREEVNRYGEGLDNYNKEWLMLLNDELAQHIKFSETVRMAITKPLH